MSVTFDTVTSAGDAVQMEGATDTLLCVFAARVIATCGPLTEALRGALSVRAESRNALNGVAELGNLRITGQPSPLPHIARPDQDVKHFEAFITSVSARLTLYVPQALRLHAVHGGCFESTEWWCVQSLQTSTQKTLGDIWDVPC